MSKRDPTLLIEDIIESGSKVLDYIGEMDFESFLKDSKTVDAVIRNFEIIGETANRIPEEFKDLHTSIDWHKIRGFRNRIVHDYMGIDYQIVWQIKEHFLPTLLIELKRL